MKYLLFIVLVTAIIAAGCVSGNKETVVTPAPTPNVWLKNCSGVEYDSRYQICCGSTLHKSELYGYQCCGEKYISDVVDNLFCCSGESYNTTNFHCCNGKVEPEGRSYDYEDCGNTCYDKRTDSCCNGQVTKGILKFSLCGNLCYNFYEQTCCYGQLCSKGWKCCNDKDKGPTCYNPETHLCWVSFDDR